MGTHPLAQAIEELRAGRDAVWDADDSMDDVYVMSLPIGSFILAAHAFDSGVVCWLTYFVARRALPCWEVSCAEARPRRIVEALGGHLHNGADVDWADAERATPSPFRDCRYSDTQSASNAVAEAARYIHGRDPLHAVYCVSAADVAYDHVLTEDRFREWPVGVAIPVALERREMNPEEREAMRGSGGRVANGDPSH